jgi:hypothetical protein
MHYIFKGASVQNTNDREYSFLFNEHFSVKKHQSKIAKVRSNEKQNLILQRKLIDTVYKYLSLCYICTFSGLGEKFW